MKLLACLIFVFLHFLPLQAQIGPLTPKGGILTRAEGLLFTNKPELAEPLINGFIQNAEARGIEVRGRIHTINKILFLPYGGAQHVHKNGICTITIGLAKYDSNWDITRKTYHEIGHHFGLRDCGKCTYNIMARFQDSVSVRLFENKPVRLLYIDLFFEQLRNPKKYNLGHQHY